MLGPVVAARTICVASTGMAVGGVLLLAGAVPAGADASVLDGRTVMERVDARPRGADEMLRASWRLIGRTGKERVRETRSYWKDQRAAGGGLHSKRLIVFDSPATIKDMAFLVVSHLDAEAEDLRWVYLPALRKVRRIAGGDRDKLFAGSDFSYEDLSERGVGEDDHVLLRTESREGARHHVVESRPRGSSPYRRRVQWVHADHHTISRVEFYDRHDRLVKVLEGRWREVDGIWFWDRLEMENRRRQHRTVVEVSEIRHDLGLGDEVFNENALRFGVP
jgi:hypothetical protein